MIIVAIISLLMPIIIAGIILENKSKIVYDLNGIICNVEIDTNDKYQEDGMTYFYVKVKNYDSSLENKINSKDIKYNLTITNSNGSYALYKYIDENGIGNNEALPQITTKERNIGTKKEVQVTKVYVIKTQSTKSKVDFEVKLNIID